MQAVSSGQVEIRLDLAERYLLESEPRMALDQLRTVQGIAPDNPRLHFNLGMTYSVLDDFSRSAASFERAVELDPDYGEAWNNLGQVRQSMRDFAGAAYAYEQALSVSEYMTPEFAAYNLGSLNIEMKKYDEALSWSVLGIEKNRRYIPLYVQTAQLLQKAERYAEAVEVLEAGVTSRPDSAQLRLMLAELLLGLSRDREAMRWFESIIQQSPDSNEASTAQDYLEVLR
ncbi:tetratricopeptide repeat protein [Desulfonatronovibrio magnus]|uniref:tetratricopeptide repeat protein n=1 Tax=Desulfonatronovibrio magnus TaxID=698827 RepID=UPI0005EBAB0A|nr:tetratricopeptide repeat protein [Desulfonatronovibrio magnus]